MICPTCKRVFQKDTERGEARPPAGPFCSARCRSADLGNWLAGNYRIGSPLAEEDLDASPIAEEDGSEGGDPPGPAN